jgi:DNA-binding Lrp family transcriptional regulator
MHHLDDLDVRILRELCRPGPPQWNVRESFSSISKRLGVDEETVRLRIKRAKETGFLPGWGMMVNPRLVGCEAAGLELEVGDEEKKAEVISKVMLVDGVTDVVDFRGRGLQVLMYYEDDESQERRVRLLRAICSSPAVATWKIRFPLPDIRMKKVDWMIAEAMRHDARADLHDVASSLGMSVRTVQRRLSMMEQGNAVYLVSVPNVERLGGVMANFLVFCPDATEKRVVDQAVRSTFVKIGYSDTSPEHYSTFAVACENLSEADAVLAKLKAIDGVQTVRMGILKQLLVVQDWLYRRVNARYRGDAENKTLDVREGTGRLVHPS